MPSYDQRAYARQILLPQLGEAGQRRLQQSRALIIGMGGLGAPVATYLAAAGVGHLTLVDGDTVDISNLHRQTLFGVNDIGQHKASTAAARLRQHYPWLDVKAIPAHVSATQADIFAAAHDLILECTDSLAAKFLVQDAAFRAKKPLVIASLYQWEGQLTLYAFDRLRKGCMRCLWPTQPAEGCIGTCAETGMLGSMVGLLGSMQAQLALLHLLGESHAQTGSQLIVNGLDFTTRSLALPVNPACPLCGDACAMKVLEQQPAKVAASLDAVAPPYTLVDLREAEEVKKRPLPASLNALHLPLSRFERERHTLPEGALVLLCQSGKRSSMVAGKLATAGHTQAYSLAGGVNNFSLLQDA